MQYPILFPMKISIERFPETKHEEVIVIKLWQVYLHDESDHLFQKLSDLSIDLGPIVNYDTKGRLTFRFAIPIWEQKVKGLLYKNRIPVSIQSNPFYAVQFKGGILEGV